MIVNSLTCIILYILFTLFRKKNKQRKKRNGERKEVERKRKGGVGRRERRERWKEENGEWRRKEASASGRAPQIYQLLLGPPPRQAPNSVCSHPGTAENWAK